MSRLLVAAVGVVCFAPFLARGWTLYDVRTYDHYLSGAPGPSPVDRGDTILSLPMLHRLYADGLREGELRLWNPSLFCGYPAYSDLLLRPFYPPNLLLFSIFPPRIAFDLGLFLHFLGSGLAMLAMLRGLGRGPWGASLGAVLWMLQGYFALWFSPGTVQGLSVFLPLALLALERGRAPLGGLALGVAVLGTHGQHALLAFVFCAAWAALRRRTLRDTAAFFGVALGAGAVGIAAQLDAVLHGFRVPGGDFALHYASPFRLPTYLLGAAFGKLHAFSDPLLASEFTIFAGVAGTLLAGLAAARHERPLGLLALGTLGLAFFEPLARLASTIPLLNLSMPARWVFVFTIALPLLASRGLDELIRDPGRKPLALAAGGVLLFLLALAASKHRVPDGLLESLLALGLAVAGLLLVPRHAPAGASLLLASLLLDLLPGFMDVNRHAPPRDFAPPVQGASRTLGYPGAAVPPADGWRVSIGNNLLVLDSGVESPAGYASLAPLRSAEWAAAVSGPGALMGSGRALGVFRFESRLLDAAAVGELRLPFDHVPGGRWVPLPGKRYRNPDALPRVFLRGRAVSVAGPAEAAKVFEGPDFDPRAAAVVEGPLSGLKPGQGTVTETHRSPDRLEFRVVAESPQLLVVADTFHPGWEATINGRPAPILPANLAFRGVAVPPGTSTVVMRFRPPLITAGAWISGLTILAVGLLQIRRPAESPTAS